MLDDRKSCVCLCACVCVCVCVYVCVCVLCVVCVCVYLCACVLCVVCKPTTGLQIDPANFFIYFGVIALVAITARALGENI